MHTPYCRLAVYRGISHLGVSQMFVARLFQDAPVGALARPGKTDTMHFVYPFVSDMKVTSFR